MSKAEEIEARAAGYVMRRSEPGWSDAEERELQQWLTESMMHKAAFWRLEQGWTRLDRVVVLREPPSPKTKLWRSRHFFRALAAGLAVIVCGASFLAYVNQTPVAPTTVAYSTPQGAHRIVALPDHSIVELNTGSAIESAVDARRRQVYLRRGEAYFEVVHDRTRPFVVQAGGQQITVLGTKFSVRMDDDKVTVAVLEGRVRLQSNVEVPEPASELGRGDLAIAEGSEVLITRGSVARIEDQLAWRNGLIRFGGATLASVAAEFNRYNAKKLVVVDPRAAEISLGGTFHSSNIDGFVHLLQHVYGLHVEATDHEIRISTVPPKRSSG